MLLLDTIGPETVSWPLTGLQSSLPKSNTGTHFLEYTFKEKSKRITLVYLKYCCLCIV